MIKNQIHSNLYKDLTKLKDKLNCVKIKFNFEKNNNWDIWMYEDEDIFYKNKRFIIKELKSQIKKIETEIYKVKHAIKISQKNYNKNHFIQSL